jgi:gliding motility-associated-like protein
LVNGTLNVNKATLTATADDKAKTYGDANPVLIISYAGFVNGEGALNITEPTIATTANASSGADTYDITLTGGAADNYSLTTNNGSLTIEKATLTAKADNKSKVKGQVNPTFTISYTGFVNGDTEADIDSKPLASTIADETTAAGNAVISLSGGSDNNYTFNLLDGTLNIIATSVTTSVVVPSAATYKIGDNLDFEASWLLPVTITGTPSIAVTIGSKTVEAQLLGTVSNGSTSTFRYTVAEGDLDVDGISVGTTISLNGGTIKDQSGVNALLSLNNIASSTTVFVDGIKPTPTLSTSATAIVNGSFTVTFTYDETVSNFQLADITVTNGIASNFTSVTTGSVWTADITPTVAGNVTVSLAVGVANDQAGNGSVASNTINREFNNVPTDISLSASSIVENNALSAIVSAISTTDLDAGDSHSYSLVSGTGDEDNSSFAIEGSNLKTNSISFNYETKTSYSIRLKTEDGKGGVFEKSFIISVTNVNESPFALSLTNSTIEEADEAQQVGSLMSLDPDNGDTFTYTLVSGTGDTNNAEFAITGTTLSTIGMINFEKGATRSILVRVTDAGGLSFDQQFTINIEEVEIEPIREYNTNTPGAEVKNVFSPNGDGVNETWVIDDIKDNPLNEVKVYAQGGKLIFSQVNYQNDWGGTFKGNAIPDGTYYYEINIYNGQKIIKGFLTIIRNR